MVRSMILLRLGDEGNKGTRRRARAGRTRDVRRVGYGNHHGQDSHSIRTSPQKTQIPEYAAARLPVKIGMDLSGFRGASLADGSHASHGEERAIPGQYTGSGAVEDSGTRWTEEGDFVTGLVTLHLWNRPLPTSAPLNFRIYRVDPPFPLPLPVLFHVNFYMGRNTYEALSTFIQSQKSLLAQTQRDIELLKKLRAEVIDGPEFAVDNLGEKLNDGFLCLHKPSAIAAEVHQDIDWSLFKAHDPSSMRMLATNLRTTQQERNQPSTKQRSPLSHLQQFVKDARRTILDPILSTFVLSDDSSDEEELSPEELKKQRERQKIRELRMRRIGEGGLTLPHGGSGVYIRKDLEDESGEVNISLDDERNATAAAASSAPPSVPVDSSITPPLPEASTSTVALSGPSKPSRSRRPGTKSRPQEASVPPTKAKSNGRPAQSKPKRSLESDEEAEAQPAKRAKEKETGKPRPETYKQAWSVSEQHLLERLLEEIPAGEKNRWAKISKAMNGRRTPRQVASRVQKYFEKLKRFGVEIGGSQAKMEEDPP
ncbi:hypothetical protein EVG20_g7609 [Dentipellis fragilis]|uniref:Uncharacterized protein n=1 Tax=Dentipellis fragilis TaxID=205917 RepID=A0A4Y9YEP9_9AGAM|nr:hypothetical protein EVG20_g7609 [Dentipellis fragilis]